MGGGVTYARLRSDDAIGGLPDAWRRPPHRGALVALLWTAYFGVAPVAWLPGVSVRVWSAAKVGLFVIAVALTWWLASVRRTPGGLVGPMGLGLVALGSVFAMFQAVSYSLAARRLGELALAFGLLWTIYVYERSFGGFIRIGAWAAVFHALLGIAILAGAAGVFSLSSPEVFEAQSIVDSGFGGWHTGWSGSVALFIPFALAMGLSRERPGIRLVMIGSVGVTIAGQIVTGGRAGVLVCLLAVLAMVAFRYGWIGLVWSGFAAAALAVASYPFLREHLRFDRLTSLDAADVDAFSSRRVSLYKDGLERIAERPLVGHGYGNVTFEYGNPADPITAEIHNLWLRMAAEGGVVLVVALIAVAASVLVRGYRSVRRLTVVAGRAAALPAAAYLVTVLGGMLVSMFEPNLILGTMHPSMIWWASAGAMAALAGNRAGRRASA